MTSGIEILAPAGSPEALRAAVDSGADAVYFGGKTLSARKNAVNFTNEEIKEAVRYAHLRGVKLYAAVNTLLFDDELHLAFDFIKLCYEASVDALIVQDLAIVSMVKRYFPDFPIHASTQMTIHNLAGVREAEKLGFKRVVLSRELSFDEISYIANNTGLELEVFVHGAMCMSYSGQCLMSSFLGGRSGNRGACAQPCRLSYTLVDSHGDMLSKGDKYLLSLKDMCLIDYISKLKAIGITSLKIEGRMKSAAYVSAVCGIYNKYRDGGRVSSEDMELLKNIFSRGGFSDGHFTNEHGKNMLSIDKNHDDIYSTATDSVIEAAKAHAVLNKKNLIDAVFTMKKDKPLYFKASYKDKVFELVGDEPVQIAKNAPMDSARVEGQLRKLGSTTIEYNSLQVDVDDGLFISVKEINNIRRRLTDMVEDYILGAPKKYKGEEFTLGSFRKKQNDTPTYTASVLNEAQAQACYDLGFDRIYIPYRLYIRNKKKYDSEPDVYSVKLPPVFCDSTSEGFKDIGVNSVCVTNIGGLNNLPPHIEKHADYRMNITNSLSLDMAEKLGFKSVSLSTELTLAQIATLKASLDTELVVYGKLPLMTIKNCLVKSSLARCGCKTGELYYLRDRKNAHFCVEPVKGDCINIIYNSVPVFMADRLNELKKANASMYRFEFTDEDSTKIEYIYTMYQSGKKCAEPFTRGHLYTGVTR